MDDSKRPLMARFALWLYERLMALADGLTRYTVVLPWRANIEWPNVCLVCGAAQPQRTWPVYVTRIGGWSLLAGIEPPWRRRRLDVPVCVNCRSRCRRQTWQRRIVPAAVLIVILLGGLAIARSLATAAPTLAKFVHVIAVLGSIGTAIVIGVSIGWLIDINVRRNELHFEFSSRALAEALADANGVGVPEPEPIPRG